MLSESRLRVLDALIAKGSPVVLYPPQMELFVAAARVANAAARVEHEILDARGRSPRAIPSCYGGTDDPKCHLRRARADLARALRHYTAAAPVEVRP